MFANQPHTTHTSRSYSHLSHTATGRKNVHKENQNALPSKTPLRPLGEKQGFATVGRTALGVKTDLRDRNALERQVGGDKGKGKEGEDIGPKRLFQSTSNPSAHIGPSKSISSFPSIPPLNTSRNARPMGKTPARPPPTARKALRTPAAPSIYAAPVLPAPAEDPVSATPLPSMQRHRRSRSRQSLSSIAAITPSASAVSFATPPAAQGWEEENSLGSIHEAMEMDMGEAMETLGEEEVDGEPEYMPPKVQELPYEPMLENADSTELVRRLMSLPLNLGGGDLRPVPELSLDSEVDVRPRMKSDEEIEEPMFRNILSSKPSAAPSKFAAPKVSFARPTAVIKGAAPRPSATRPPAMSKPSSITSRQSNTVRPGMKTAFASPKQKPVPAELLAPMLDAMGMDNDFQLDLNFD